jgi:hypothetical protein
MLKTLVIVCLLSVAHGAGTYAYKENDLPTLDDVLSILEAERPVVTVESRLTEFYQKHNPTKMGDIPKLLKKFEGREEAMFQALEEKYVRLWGRDNGAVVHLKEATFDDTRTNSRTSAFLVMFYASKDADKENFPKLRKVFGGVSVKVEKYVQMGAVDCSSNAKLCAKYGADKQVFTWAFFKDKTAEPEALFADFGEGVFPEDNDFMNAVARGTGNNRWEL